MMINCMSNESEHEPYDRAVFDFKKEIPHKEPQEQTQ